MTNDAASAALIRSSVRDAKRPECSLEEALDYTNSDVLECFLSRYRLDPSDADDLFTETKRWLWLNGTAGPNAPEIGIWPALRMLDEMWHSFILVTSDYCDYCMSRFGKYIHHEPTTLGEKRQLERLAATEPAASLAAREDELRRQLSYVYDRLGPETVIKWFSEYPEKYTAEFISSVAVRLPG